MCHNQSALLKKLNSNLNFRKLNWRCNSIKAANDKDADQTTQMHLDEDYRQQGVTHDFAFYRICDMS